MVLASRYGLVDGLRRHMDDLVLGGDHRSGDHDGWFRADSDHYRSALRRTNDHFRFSVNGERDFLIEINNIFFGVNVIIKEKQK